MQKINTVVAVYGTHPEAEQALHALQSSGFDMKKLPHLAHLRPLLPARDLPHPRRRRPPWIPL